MAEEQELTQAEPQPTAEAIKQRKKREKAAAKDAALGVEKFTVEVAGVFKPDLKRVMAAHGFNNQQEVYQNLLCNLIAADFETQAQMLRCVTTLYEPSEKVSRAFYEKSMSELNREPGDEIIEPDRKMVGTGGFEPPAELSGSKCYSSNPSQFEYRSPLAPPRPIQMLPS